MAEIHDLGIGRSAADLVRKVKAAQYVAANDGEVCPAKWQPGEETLKPSLDLIGKLFSLRFFSPRWSPPFLRGDC